MKIEEVGEHGRKWQEKTSASFGARAFDEYSSLFEPSTDNAYNIALYQA